MMPGAAGRVFYVCRSAKHGAIPASWDKIVFNPDIINILWCLAMNGVNIL